MAFVPFTDCCEVVCQGILASQVVMLTFGAQKSGGFIGTDQQDLADAVAGWLTTSLLPILSDDLEMDQVKVTDLTSAVSPVVVSVAGLPANGGVSGIPVPNNVAGVVSFKTALRGRTARGRNYLPAAPSGALVTTTSFTGTFAGQMEGAYTDLATIMAAIGVAHVVLSRTVGKVQRVLGVATPVTTYIGRTAVGTQRRRVIGHGV